MKKLKKLPLVMLVFMLMGIANPIGVSSEWKQSSQGWWYTKENSYSIGWNKIDGNWYYFNNTGLMQNGWIDDNGTWYYLNDSGSLDESKTTTVMPDEIEMIYDIVDIYNDLGILKYSSEGYSDEVGLSGKRYIASILKTNLEM